VADAAVAEAVAEAAVADAEVAEAEVAEAEVAEAAAAPTAEKRFKCDCCERVMSTAWYLKKHKEEVCKSVPRNTCAVCRVTFPYRQKLYHHVRKGGCSPAVTAIYARPFSDAEMHIHASVNALEAELRKLRSEMRFHARVNALEAELRKLRLEMNASR
jgi:hypothetical protein